MTLFLYIWPGEEEALSQAPDNCFYCSNIHSHPIPCAVTVLRGSIDQITYQEVTGGCNIRKIGEERLFPGRLIYDDQNEPFIHQMVSREKGEPTVTLHAYGAPTARKVMDTFRETRSDCSCR